MTGGAASTTSEIPPIAARDQTRRVNKQLYRARGWKKLLKPIVVRSLSSFWMAWFRFRLGQRVQFGRNFVTNGRLVIIGPGRVIFGDDVHAWAHAEKNVLITHSPDSRVTIGDRCQLNGAGIQAYTHVDVGDDCILSSTIIFDSDFHPLDPKRRHDPDAPVECGPITLEKNVWVGGQSAILKGVRIGENSVVAFRAVVSKDVPPNVVVAGNPAKIVKHLDEGE